MSFSISSDSPHGKYKLLYDIVEADHASVNHCDADIFNPGDTKPAVAVSYPKSPFKSVVTLKTLSNKSGQNDWTSNDELSVYIFSDALRQQFKCTEFTLKQSGIINFNSLQIPCNNYIVLSLVEGDTFSNDG